jgi:hypothetical protein
VSGVGYFGVNTGLGLSGDRLLDGGADGGVEDAVGGEVAAEEEHGDQPPGRADELDAEPSDDDQGEPGTSMAGCS